MPSPEAWSQYASPRNELRRYLISCHGAGEQSGRVPPFQRRALPTHGLVYVSEGRGNYREFQPRRLDIEVQAPAIIWLAPGVEHGYGPDRDGWSEHWILFAGQSFAAFEALGLGSRHRPVVPLSRPVDGARDLFAELRRALETVGARPEIAASLATQRILLAILDATGDDEASRTVVDDVARDATRAMTVADRARRVGLTPRQLGAAVKAATGLTLNDFVIEVRVAKAQALLVETALDVVQIADIVGYADSAYFSRLFARRVGVAPTVFRRQQSRGGIG